MLDRIKPAAIFSMGGFVAGPVLLAALWKRLPVVVMEPNAIPGFTHRRLARFVARALVSFPETARWFPKGRTEVTGRPVSQEFFSIPRRPPQEHLALLITGGSQGSRALNRAMEESWPLWKDRSIRLLHQTGVADYESLAAGFGKSGLNGAIAPFFDDMPGMFAQADLVISRAGGMVSELAAAGKPSILVPLPTAADQHQLRNAEAFRKSRSGSPDRGCGVDRSSPGGRGGAYPGRAQQAGVHGRSSAVVCPSRRGRASRGDSGNLSPLTSTLTSRKKAETIQY